MLLLDGGAAAAAPDGAAAHVNGSLKMVNGVVGGEMIGHRRHRVVGDEWGVGDERGVRDYWSVVHDGRCSHVMRGCHQRGMVAQTQGESPLSLHGRFLLLPGDGSGCGQDASDTGEEQ